MNFKEKVLKLAQQIPKGKITTYKEIAEKLGTKAYRAAGTALKNNKHPIMIPCHRVVKSNGEIGGYLGKKSCKKKKFLLEKEGIEVKGRKIADFEKKVFRFK